MSAAPTRSELENGKLTHPENARHSHRPDIVLDIANFVAPLLEQHGIQVSMTRTGYEPSLGLGTAAIRANDYGADMVVSIHVNAGGGTGTESCYVVNKSTSGESRRLAELLTNEVSSQLFLHKRGDFPENNSGRCGRGWGQLYIHDMNPVSALIETAFVDGPQDNDVEKLRYRRQDFAKAIADAIVKYFGSATNATDSVTCPNQNRAEYYNNGYLSGSPTFIQCEDWPINRNWGSGSPGNGVGYDNFSVRWTGRAYIAAGTYTFIAQADDGIRVWIDNNLVINAWRDQPPTEYRATHSLSSGEHNIKVEYYENSGGAMAQFRWEQTSGSSGGGTSTSNLALGKPASASSVERGDESQFGAKNATDGSPNTRWSSRQQYEGGQESESIWVDLQGWYDINRVVLHWEAAAVDYRIAIWNGSRWETVINNYNRRGGVETITFSTKRTCCVAVVGLKKINSSWGYSLREFEVYGP